MKKFIETKIYAVNNVDLAKPKYLIIPISRIYEIDPSNLFIIVDRGGEPIVYDIDDGFIDNLLEYIVADEN